MTMAGLKKMRRAAGAAALLVAAGTAGAQVSPSTIPGLENYSLPEATVRPQPLPSPTPTPTPTPTVTPTPTPTATPTAAVPAGTLRPAPTPTPTPSPAATRAPAAVPSPIATPTAAPSPVPTVTEGTANGTLQEPEQRELEAGLPDVALPDASLPGATLSDGAGPTVSGAAPAAAGTDADGGRGGWLWPILIGLIVLVGAGLFLWRRRPERLQALPAPWAEERQPLAAPVPVAPPQPVAPLQPSGQVRTPVQGTPADQPRSPATPAEAPRFLDRSDKMPPAQIALDEPVVSRAGVNMVTATADVTVVLRNTSDVPARGVVLDVRLTSAQPNQDAALAALFAGPAGRPAAPPFDLAPGETKRVRALVTMPRDAITVLQAGGRPMFVPVVAIRALHAGGQTTAVHALGIERPGQAKLGPFWLDQPSRMFDTVGVRPHSGQW